VMSISNLTCPQRQRSANESASGTEVR